MELYLSCMTWRTMSMTEDAATKSGTMPTMLQAEKTFALLSSEVDTPTASGSGDPGSNPAGV
jgi:hypothetical protein